MLVATAVGSLTGALGLQCGGSSKTSVTTTQLRIGPYGTSAENGQSLSGMTVTVAISTHWACSTVTPFVSPEGGGARRYLSRDLKRLASVRRLSDARDMQKRAVAARRRRRPHKPGLLARLSLVLVATAVGSLTGALGLQCGGSSKTSVTTTQLRIGPYGTSAENG